MEKQMIKNIDYYMALHYPIILTPEEDGWGAIIPDLPGCVGGGDTIEEALIMLEDARRGWLESALTHNDFIPEPSTYPKTA